jgi:hypothetical protein
MVDTSLLMRMLITSSMVLALAAACGPESLSVEGVSPRLGVIRGGEKVTIDGAGFDQQSGYSVYFGGSRATHVAIAGEDRLWATTPAVDEAGPVDVRIVAADGTTFRISGGFEFVEKNELAECVNISRALNGEPPGKR